ncbi:CbiX/SirB N-terminal domain-containing protein [Nonomuraea sp. B12E4]|uniref:sirohydrochlorin chelatase n=1 Tax=Nonomuraea sp. B12E4 TaxID=3153564 RepID=UPI00325F208C
MTLPHPATPGAPIPGGSPTLLLAAHGTRSGAGERTLAALAEAAAAARPGCRVELGYLEISSPLLSAVLPAVRGPVVVVPLLLAGGFHAHVDLPAVVAEHRPDAVVARWLGPHRLLTSALARRLAGAGLRATDAVLLGAAGSADPAALADVRAAAHRLAVRLARPVTAAFAASGTPSLPEAMERLASTPAAPRVAIASYVLAPGHFHDRLATAGAGLVSDPLGADPDVAALIWHRYDEALTALPATPAPHQAPRRPSTPATPHSSPGGRSLRTR